MIEGVLLALLGFVLGTFVGPDLAALRQKWRRTITVFPMPAMGAEALALLPIDRKSWPDGSVITVHRYTLSNRTRRNLHKFNISVHFPKDVDCYSVISSSPHADVILQDSEVAYNRSSKGVDFLYYEKGAMTDLIVVTSARSLPKMVITEGFHLRWIAPSYENAAEYGYFYGYGGV